MTELLMGLSAMIVIIGFLYIKEWRTQSREQHANEQFAKEMAGTTEPPDDAWSRKLKIASNRSKADWEAIREMKELGRRKYDE